MKISEKIWDREFDYFIEKFKEGKTDFEKKDNLIREVGEFINKRSYFTLDKDGEIKRKDLNLALYKISRLTEENYKENIEDIVLNNLDPRERIKIKKIPRLSGYKIEELEKNFNKIFVKGELSFGLRYSKELLNRDKEKFFQLLFGYILMEDISTKKSIMGITLYNLIKDIDPKKVSDQLIYGGLSYILQRPASLRNYELLRLGQLEKIQNEEGLELESYIEILNLYTGKNKEYFEKLARK